MGVKAFGSWEKQSPQQGLHTHHQQAHGFLGPQPCWNSHHALHLKLHFVQTKPPGCVNRPKRQICHLPYNPLVLIMEGS